MSADGGVPMSAAVERALQDLYKRHGRLDPSAVVDVARNPSSVLHDRFEWDDSVAAEQWRLQQARMLIRSIRIERVVDDSNVPRAVRAYVHDPENDGYLATEDVAKMADVRDRVLEDIRADLSRLQKKWELYRETFERIAAEVLLSSVAEGETAKPPRTRTHARRTATSK